jgi:flagellin-like protein
MIDSELINTDTSQRNLVSMRKLLKTKEAVSPILATLLIIVIVVAAAIASYTWVQSFMGNQFSNAGSTFAIENVRWYDTDKIDITVRNTGTATITIATIYIDGIDHQVEEDVSAGDALTATIEQSWTTNQNCRIKVVTKAGIMAEGVYTTPSVSQLDWIGDGSDGALVVSSANQIINDYAYLIGNENSGDTTITVNNSTRFSAGDEILVIQIQNSSSGVAGTYEFKRIASITVNDLTLSSALSNSYYSGSFDRVGATSSQIVRVPQYTSVTVNSGCSITAPAWNGYTGGIVVFRASGTVTINSGGKVDVGEKGFRGGLYGPGYNLDGFQGESYLGKGIGGSSYGLGKMNNAGGGGSYICGGGGEYGGGATNSDPWTGSGDTYARKGAVYGTADLSQIFFGSGGGGQWKGSDAYGPPSDGGDGGGIIIIYASSIIAATDSFLAIGGTTSGIQQGSYTYGSSGGAGGSIFLTAETIQGAINFCRAVGGLGNHAPIRHGGDGGVGRIRLDYNSLAGTTNPSPGYTGLIP